MAKKEPFAAETQQKPIVRRLNQRLHIGGYPGGSDLFWESDRGRFISRDSLLEGADIVEVHMTREQWQAILNDKDI